MADDPKVLDAMRKMNMRSTSPRWRSYRLAALAVGALLASGCVATPITLPLFDQGTSTGADAASMDGPPSGHDASVAESGPGGDTGLDLPPSDSGLVDGPGPEGPLPDGGDGGAPDAEAGPVQDGPAQDLEVQE